MKNSARIALLFLGDIAMMVIAFFVMLKIAFPEINNEILTTHIRSFSVIALLWILIFFIFNFYNTQLVTPTIKHLKRIIYAFLVAMSVSVIAFYIFPFFTITPKTNLLIWGIGSILCFIIWRRIFYTIFSSFFKKHLVIIKKERDSYTQELISYLESNPQTGYSFDGYFSSLEDFVSYAQNQRVDTIIVSQRILNNAEDFQKLYNMSEYILDFTHAYEDLIGKIPVSSIDDEWFLHNIPGKNRLHFEWLSHAIGVLLAGLGLIISLPITITIVIALTLQNDGPLFYTQTRLGKNGRPFTLYKFRSMKTYEDRGLAWTEKNDTRITPVGRIMRKIHMDEIPQLWNILKGDIVLVGPRPEIPDFAEKLEDNIPFYYFRHIIKPGFTGWAQIKFRNARGIEESKEKFEYDLYYIKNRNIFMDLGIILRTVIIFFTHDN